eukprot:6266272-Ditylum_brightwellii.AAC.1
MKLGIIASKKLGARYDIVLGGGTGIVLSQINHWIALSTRNGMVHSAGVGMVLSTDYSMALGTVTDLVLGVNHSMVLVAAWHGTGHSKHQKKRRTEHSIVVTDPNEAQ